MQESNIYGSSSHCDGSGGGGFTLEPWLAHPTGRFFESDPFVGVAVIETDGAIRFANPCFGRLFLGKAFEGLNTYALSELLPEVCAREFLTVIERVVENQKPVRVRSLRRGTEVYSTFYPTVPAEGSPAACLVISLPGHIDGERPPDPVETIQSKHADLGTLDVLSRRELEVLALLGQGLPRAAIAKELHRSPKTIDNHFESISSKLRAANRIELAKLATRSGLRVSDAATERTHEAP